MPIAMNQSRGGKVVIRATANEFYIVAGNSSVSNLFSAADITITELAVPYLGNTQVATDSTNQVFLTQSTANIVITGAHPILLNWTSNGFVSIYRGGNSTSLTGATLVYNLPGYGEMSLRALGISSNGVNDFSAANLQIVFNANTTIGTIIVELAKEVTYVGEY